MDRDEAGRLLRAVMIRFARRSRAELAQLMGQVEVYSVEGAGGVAYQIEVDAHWDGEPGGTIRVLGSIEDGGFRSSFRPMTDGFLVDAAGAIEMADLEKPG